MSLAITQDSITRSVHEAAKKLIEEFGLADLELSLIELPDKIRGKQEQIAKKQQENDILKRSADEIRTAMNDIRAITEAEVITELNEDSKPRYSNDKLRSAETSKRLLLNDDYQARKAELSGIEESISVVNLDVVMLRNDIGRLESLMANYRAVLAARAEQLRAIFG